MKISILGEGAWGTACASLIAHNGYPVTLWCYNAQIHETIKIQHKNNIYAPGFTLNTLITSTTNLQEALTDVTWVFEAIPVKFLRSVLEKAQPFISQQQWVILSKGIESQSLLFPSQLIDTIFGLNTKQVILSGPSFARELLEKKPTAVMLASHEKSLALNLKTLLDNSYFKTSISADTIGVQICGAFKNCIALGSGILEELYASENTRALYIIQSSKELALILRALGGQTSTLYDLAGLGDLLLTALSMQSRNTQVGKALARGKTLQEITQSTSSIPESLNTLISLNQIIKKYTLHTPILSTLYSIVYAHAAPSQLLETLLRSLDT